MVADEAESEIRDEMRHEGEQVGGFGTLATGA